MPIPASVQTLIERFDLNRAAYHSGQYNEAQVRQEFINPFSLVPTLRVGTESWEQGPCSTLLRSRPFLTSQFSCIILLQSQSRRSQRDARKDNPRMSVSHMSAA